MPRGNFCNKCILILFIKPVLNLLKYVVLLDTLKDGEMNESESLGFYDTREEADQMAVNKLADMSEDYLKNHEVSVGEVRDDSLDDPEDWNSFREVEVVSVFPNEL
ncbi:hypothetical protein SAMN04487770_1368 [Butyrivibrio sp. ob235]|nr:hypothetical protein SAMN04487770_1368 [Butyrivibrio sp. ob235]